MTEHQYEIAVGESLQIGRFHLTLLDIENGEGHVRVDSDWGDEDECVRLADEGASEATA